MSDELMSDDVQTVDEDETAQATTELELEEALAGAEVGHPVTSLSEPGESGTHSSILDSVLHPEEGEVQRAEKLDRKYYEKELRRLQMELVKMQDLSGKPADADGA